MPTPLHQVLALRYAIIMVVLLLANGGLVVHAQVDRAQADSARRTE
jgi:hypothetical protein